MAPALAEPMSPTEKLSSSTASTTTSATSHTHSTRSTRKSESATIQSSASKDKPNNKRSAGVAATTSTRVTRSKDAYQRVFEQAINADVGPITTQTPAKKQKNDHKTSNESMGLNANSIVLNNNNNNNNNTSKPKSEDDQQVALHQTDTDSGENHNLANNSTEQLLADLTSDFEETITADICLRQQLLEAPLGKTAAIATIESSIGLESADTKDILVIKSSSEEEPIGKKIKSKPMDVDAAYKTNKVENAEAQKTSADDVDKPKDEKTTEEQVESKDDNNEEKCSNMEDVFMEPKEESPSCSQQTENQIHRVQELPPISTDSTMTASEVEDNLEERLSQLDGTAVADHSTTLHDVTIMEAEISTHSSPTPRTPTQQEQQVHQQHLELLQRQLQQTPPTPNAAQQQPENTFTPQSTTSSVNTLSSSNLPQSFMKEAGANVLEDQDFEEVLNVLKGFDGTTGGDTSLCDLNTFFNEVYTTLTSEEMNQQPSTSSSSYTTVSKPNPLKDIHTDIERQQQIMQRKIDFLVRRLRKLQSRYMCKQTSEEIAGLFEWSARIASRGGCSSRNNQSSVLGNGILAPISVIAARPPAENWSIEKKNPVAASQMCSTLRKLESSVQQQQQQQANQSTGNSQLSSLHYTSKAQIRKSRKELENQTAAGTSMAGSSDLAGRRNESDLVLPTLDPNLTEELTHVSGLLQTEMRQVQNAIDSDATESSSGGESADEMVTYNNTHQKSLSIAKRAAWRYSRDRAAIASRWSWLLSQIADLEIKIRQHSELHQEVVRTKGPVICSKKVAETAASTSAAAVNGFKSETLNLSAGNIEKSLNEEEAAESSCRTRPFVATHFRKRKLFQTTHIHTISKKAARPSTIKCGCQWPLYPCTLCTGRSDPTAPRDLPDTMMMSDRVALLDPGYHPVLSFSEDVNNSIHFEGIARLPEWQQRLMRCQVKSIAKSVWKQEREAAATSGHHYNSRKYGADGSLPTKRRYIKKKDRLAEAAAAANAGTGGGAEGAVAGSVSSNDAAGNGTGTLSTSTTPLVANKAYKKSQQQHCHLIVGDGVLLEPALIQANNNLDQEIEFLPQNNETSNHNQTHSSLISSNQHQYHLHHSSSNIKSGKSRKSSTSATNSLYSYNQNYNNNQYHLNNSQYHTANGVSDGSFMNDYWENNISARSRTSSPTHGFGNNTSSNYHKYERSLDRKNRSSYDIDNIVIPYSVAAATRVEILPYKEIPTPKWRVIAGSDKKKTETESSGSMDESVVEDSHKAISNNNCNSINSSNIAESEKLKNAETSEEEKQQLNSEIDAFKPDNIPTDVRENCDESQPDIKRPKMELATAEHKDDVDLNTKSTIENYSQKETLEDVQVSAVVGEETELDETNAQEDISDEAMILRHERALTEERRKFQTYLKFPWSTRSRANRRIDSRAESSGANTPDPTSPAPNTPSVGGGDQESIPSPLAPSTPLNPLDTISEGGESITGAFSNSLSKRYERRRTTSTKKDREMERRSSTPDLKEHLPPYEPIKFPLSDEEYTVVITAKPSEMPDNYKHSDSTILNSNIKPSRTRNSLKSDGLAKLHVVSENSYPVTKTRKSLGVTPTNEATGSASADTETLHLNGGNVLNNEIDTEDEEDDYKHHLAPGDDDFEQESLRNSDKHNVDPYKAYVGHSSLLGESGGESSETEPFQDDDPNDPEWKGESEDKAEKNRRKF